MLSRARVTGQVRHAKLSGGANIWVRVQDGQITVTWGRTPKPLGDVELGVFRRHCAVPAHAERLPSEGQDQRERTVTVEDEEHGSVPVVETWYRVGYRWKDQETNGHAAEG